MLSLRDNCIFRVLFYFMRCTPAARPRTYLLQTRSYDVSIHPRHLSVLPTVVFHLCCRHDIQTTAAVFYLTSSRPSVHSSLCSQSASGRFRFSVLPSGTTCLSVSYRRRHSRFSDNDSKPFCFPVPTKTLSYDSCNHYYRSSLLSGHVWSLQ